MLSAGGHRRTLSAARKLVRGSRIGVLPQDWQAESQACCPQRWRSPGHVTDLLHAQGEQAGRIDARAGSISARSETGPQGTNPGMIIWSLNAGQVSVPGAECRLCGARADDASRIAPQRLVT